LYRARGGEKTKTAAASREREKKQRKADQGAKVGLGEGLLTKLSKKKLLMSKRIKGGYYGQKTSKSALRR